MKTRNGFVSNSSSTSFCIYGAFVGDIGGKVPMGYRILKFLKNHHEEYFNGLFKDDDSEAMLALKDIDKLDLKKPGKFIENLEELDEENGELDDFFADLCFMDFDDKIGLMYNENYGALGFSYTVVPDEMIMGAWKTMVREAIKEITGKDLKCEHIEEAYSDG